MNINVHEGTIRPRMKPSHPVILDVEIPFEEQNERAAKVLYRLAILALRILLKTTTESPKKVSTFFNEDVHGKEYTAREKYEKLVIRDKEWQTHFFQQLQEKNAVTLINGMVGCKNRFYVETLLHESLNKTGRLLPMVCEAGDIPIPLIPERLIPEKASVKPIETIKVKTPQEQEPIQSDEEIIVSTKRDTGIKQESMDTLSILMNVQDLLTASLTYQEKLVENIVYVRDRGDKLHEKLKSLSERVAAIELKVDQPVHVEMPQLDTIKTSVNSIGMAVENMKEEVGGIVRAAMNEERSAQLEQVKTSIARITSEFDALRELALEESIREDK